MKSAVLWILAISAQIAFIGTAWGQSIHPESTSTLPYKADVDDPVMIRAMASFAGCVAIREIPASIQFLKGAQFGEPNNAEVKALIARNQDCLRSDTIKFNQVIFAGNLAEVIYRAIGFYFVNNAARFGSVDCGAKSNCGVSFKPRKVDALLASASGSNDEELILGNIEDVIEHCMLSVSRHPAVLRAVIMAGAFPKAMQIAEAH